MGAVVTIREHAGAIPWGWGMGVLPRFLTVSERSAYNTIETGYDGAPS